MHFVPVTRPFVSAINASGSYEEEFPAKEAMYYKQLPEMPV